MTKIALLLVTIVALTAVPLAAAASGTGAYLPSGTNAVVSVKGATASKPVTVASAAKPSGTLPFTGSDLTVFVVGGVALLGVGLGMRRLGRNSG